MNRRQIATTAALSVLFCAFAAQAQDVGVEQVNQAYAQATDTPVDSDVGKPSGAQIESDEGGTRLTMRFGSARRTSKDTSTAVIDQIDTTSVSMSAPFDKDSGAAPAATLDGLSKGTTIQASWSRLSISRPPRAEWLPRAIKKDQLCQTAVSNYAARVGNGGGDRATAQSQASNALDGIGCSDDFMATYDPANLNAFEELQWGKDSMTKVYGVSVRAGRMVFDYIDPATIAQRSVEKTGWSVKAYYAIQPVNASWMLTVSLEHQDSYKERDQATLCPVGGAACLTGPNGEPVRESQDLLGLDFRRSFAEFAVSLAVNYDSKSDLYSAELPIYMTRDKAGALNGGIKFNWRSDQDDIVASVFVGRTFSLGMPY